MDPPQDRVRRERNRRNWSVRRAATAGHISNTAWGRYENGQIPLSNGIRNAVAVAFDWPANWPEQAAMVDEVVDRQADRVIAALAKLEATVESEIRYQLADHERQLLDVATEQRRLAAQLAVVLDDRQAAKPASSDAR